MTGKAVPRDYGAAARTKATERALDAAIAAFLWGFRIVVVLVIVVGSYITLSSGKYSIDTWIDLIVDGASLGGVYALIALGYTMVYGILRMINFAHGDVFMIGAFAGYFTATFLRNIGILNASPLESIASIVLMMIVDATVAAVVAVLVERIAYRPLSS
jgi:branched-chain amino acid transport system permease protein